VRQTRAEPPARRPRNTTPCVQGVAGGYNPIDKPNIVSLRHPMHPLPTPIGWEGAGGSAAAHKIGVSQTGKSR
jgi:hypothetical protein